MFQILPFERIDWAAKFALAHTAILLFLFLNIVSFSLPHAGDFKPYFLLMAVYYWSIYRPTLMPTAYTFALGLIMDLQTGLPVGLSALILVGIQMIVQSQRVFLMGQPYITVWIGFAVVAIINMIAQWLVISLFSLSLMPIISPIIAVAFSIVLFPLASLILLGVHRILPLPSGGFIR